MEFFKIGKRDVTFIREMRVLAIVYTDVGWMGGSEKVQKYADVI